jgi:hypothetical protein
MAAGGTNGAKTEKAAAGCPWCGAGTKLILRGDGFGGISLWCSQCACKGPTVKIENDFADADEAAVDKWSKRASPSLALPQEVVDRVSRSVAFASVLSAGPVSETTEVSLKICDIRALMEVAVPDWLLPQSGGRADPHGAFQ